MRPIARFRNLFGRLLGRLRISHQLYGAFAIILGITGVVGGMAIDGMSRTRAEADVLASKWLQGVGHLAAARMAVLESREFEVKHSRAEDRSYHAEYEEKMAAAGKTVVTAMGAYDGLMVSNDERNLYAAFTKNWAAYQQAQQKIIKLGREKNKQDATDISDGLASTTLDEVTNALDALTKFNFSGGKAAAEQAAVVYARAKQVVMALLGAALVFGALFAFGITRRLLRQLGGEPRAAAEIALAVADGDLTQRISLRKGDTSSLMATMDKMQRDLLSRITADQKVASENLRIKNALDNASSGTMIADTEGNIVYVNKAQVEMFKRGEADLRKAFSGFNADDLLGKSIDLFHKNPAHQRNLLANLTQPHKVTVKVGGLTYVIYATPVIDEKGQRLGIAASWTDRTAEVGAEDEVASLVKAANAGDFSQRITVEGKDGFYKQLAEGINSLVHTSDVGLKDVSRVLAALAKGDLTQTVTNDYQGAFGQLKENCNQTVENLTAIVNQIKEASETIDTASKEITQGNTDLSQRTEEQASSLEETASSMEELTSTVKQNAENARQANQLAVGASDVAVKGGDVVKQVVTTMSGISESSKKIADIIGVIDGIAFQTNILALNAAVEAARAGEQGRGFAVVATEVRNLAQRSANAAKEIKGLITDSVSRVDTGTELVDEAGKTMDEIVTSVKRVTDIMAEITAASQEQSSGIEQVNQAITQMDEVTQQNAALVEEAAAAAESMQEQSGNLVQTVGTFKLAQGTGMAAIERRGPDRAVNVARLPAKPAASVPKRKPAANEPSLKKAVGADEDWQEF